MTVRTLPYADRAAGLVGSVIDSSTSLLHRQTHDIVRFAMGSPAAEAVPSAPRRQLTFCNAPVAKGLFSDTRCSATNVPVKSM